MEKFYNELASILDLAEIKADERLEDLPVWDSLAILSIIALIDARHGVSLTAAEIKAAGTARQVYEMVLRRQEAGSEVSPLK